MNTVSTIAIASAAALSMSAAAGTFTATSINTGVTNQLLDLGDVAVDVTSTGGNFDTKTMAGYQMLGVSGGLVAREIDSTESIRFEFDTAVTVSVLELGALFASGQHGDLVNERARITVNDAFVFELALTGATTANWDGFGTVTNLSAGLEGSAGYFRIAGTDIFDMAVTSITLSAPEEFELATASASDFGFGSIAVTPAVPAPGVLAIAGLGGLMCSRRRR